MDLMVRWGRQQERLLCPSESCLSLCCVQTLRYVTDVGTASLEGSWPMKQPHQIRGLGTGNGSVFPNLEHDVPHSHSRGMTASLSLNIRTTFPRLQNIPSIPTAFGRSDVCSFTWLHRLLDTWPQFSSPVKWGFYLSPRVC